MDIRRFRAVSSGIKLRKISGLSYSPPAGEGGARTAFNKHSFYFMKSAWRDANQHDRREFAAIDASIVLQFS